MPKPIFRRTLLSLAVSTMALPAAAQDSGNTALEEITVTAQKRAESLQDVSVSITAISGEKLQDAGIEKISDITAHVPNMHMTQSGISTQLRIRGIGSGNNQGFEQSVGQFVDGVHYGRPQLIRAPFMDLERVEVLRGPQSTHFGKNTIAGALNMTTARPTNETEAEVRVGHTPETGGTEVNAVFSGEISDQLLGRLAYRNNQEDGYIENTFTKSDEPNLDEQALRATLVWTPTDALDITMKAEESNFDVKGRQIEIVQDDVYSTILQQFGQPEFESEADGKRQADGGDYSDNNVSNYTLTADYQMGGNTLTSVSSWVSYEYDDLCDCDYTSADLFTVGMQEEYEQFSQEIRLASPGGERVDWILGVFYQTSEQDFYDDILVKDTSAVIPILKSQFGVPAPAADMLADTRAARNFQQDSDAWSVFGEVTWNLGDHHLTLGGRYTDEDKSGSRVLSATDFAGTPLDASNPYAPLLFNQVFDIESEQYNPENPDGTGANLGHNLEGERNESVFTPLVSYEYDLSADTMLYASYTTGFKAGGYDARANNINSFEFGEEEATSWELGTKSRFADGRAELNLALYRTDYDDLQISQFDGTLGFNVGNAEETRVQGVELDGRWVATDNLTFNYAAAYLDFEYLDFTNGNCYQGQTPDGAVAPWGEQLCDFTGEKGQATPETTVNVGLDHHLPLGGDLALNSVIDVQYVGGHHVHANQDPQYKIDAYTTVGARFSLDSGNWSAALVGKNLTDEQIMTYAGNAPLSGTFGASTYYAFMKPPRTVAIEGIYRY